ncbi:MAG: hypothetical protein B7Z22_10705 [Hyphomonas sp. 32-62-5]|nr:MAG: hypothetical protein B7Z22_10705 [Hyphomonas sp. 32-62-5]
MRRHQLLHLHLLLDREGDKLVAGLGDGQVPRRGLALADKVGQVVDVLVDDIRADGVGVARTQGDAPEIDGHIFLKGFTGLKVGEFAKAKVTRADAFDLYGEPEGLIKLDRLPTARPKGKVHRIISRF